MFSYAFLVLEYEFTKISIFPYCIKLDAVIGDKQYEIFFQSLFQIFLFLSAYHHSQNNLRDVKLMQKKSKIYKNTSMIVDQDMNIHNRLASEWTLIY